MVFCMSTQKPGEAVWHWDAVCSEAGKDHVEDMQTITYMSHLGLRYRVERYEEWGPGMSPIGLISDTIYEPRDDFAKIWEKYEKEER